MDQHGERHEPLFLIGFMCSGKTTLGKALARATGREFIDLDDMVEAQAGMSVSQIFATEGEEAFRRREREALEQACDKGPIIVACGGGTPCRPGAMEMMNQRGLTVYLRPSAERLTERLLDGRANRPLISAISTADEMEAFAAAKLREREPYYTMAAAIFDSSMLESDAEIQASVQDFVSRFLTQP
ncbi:MAG: shikimate kinase [Bacteroidales bacterium]|nr:shikimate kinase [Bacteroidales bacterium]